MRARRRLMLDQKEIRDERLRRTVYESGGWRTVTTKQRMNEYGVARIFSDRGVWYAHLGSDSDAVPYADGLTLNADGTWSHVGNPRATQRKRKQWPLRRMARVSFLPLTPA